MGGAAHPVEVGDLMGYMPHYQKGMKNSWPYCISSTLKCVQCTLKFLGKLNGSLGLKDKLVCIITSFL